MASLILASYSYGPTPTRDWVIFLLMSVAFATFPIPVGKGQALVFLMPLVLALTSTNGVLTGVLTTAVGVAVAQFIHRKPWEKAAFNTLALSLEAAVAGLTFVLAGQKIGAPLSIGLVGVLVLMSLMGSLVNSILLAGLFAVLESKGFTRHLISIGVKTLRQAPIEALVAILFLAVFQTIGHFGLLFMAVLLVLVRYGFQSYYQLQASYEEVQTMLISILDGRDTYTAGHSQRVSENAVLLAKEMRLSGAEVENIRRAGLLHDIGKVNVPDDILKKPGKLSKDETQQMNQHPVEGARFVEGVSSLKHLAPIIRHHHERYNGKGYPDGISGETIPLGARVLSVADAFDAMITDRPYRKALTRAQALQQILENAGTQFDKQVAMAAVKVLGSELEEYPQLQSLAAAVRLQLAATKEESAEGQA